MPHFLTALTIFISAYLLFFIQPLLAKSLLPLMGGSATVWLAGMLFFQAGLLLGYGYAYLITKYFSERKQALIHGVLLLLSFYFIPVRGYSAQDITPLWQPLAVLKSYATHILLPFAMLSATSPLLQHWYCRLRQTIFPYYFYAISNGGSLIGLIGYPLLLEPFWGIKTQSILWSGLYGIYALLVFICLYQVFKKDTLLPLYDKSAQHVSKKATLKWVGLAFLGCAVFLAVTQFLVQNIINLPVMWVFPLALYLISFIITFAKPKGYESSFWIPTFLIWLILMMWLILHQQLGGLNVIIVVLGLQYSACMVCHGELIRLKPPVTDLTLFYFYIALGGVLGGIFVNIVAPFVFQNWWDFYLPLLVINIIIIRFYLKEEGLQQKWLIAKIAFSTVALVITTFSLCNDLNIQKTKTLAQYRNPYGFIKVIDNKEDNAPYRALFNGTVMHGLQFLTPSREAWPTTYYGAQTGIGMAFQFLREINPHPLRIAVIGLGAGTLATFTQKGDALDFYEIDKDVIHLATTYFSFLHHSLGKTQIFLGDARIELQKRVDSYDLIVVDAFNGDAIPFHLLTKEAMQLYLSKLEKNGIIAFNATNTYLDFLPVVAGLARDAGYEYEWVINGPDLSQGVFPAYWALISDDPNLKAWLEQKHLNLRSKTGVRPTLWTDDKNSILPLLKLG